MSPDPKVSAVDPGCGTPFEIADFPDPPRNLNFSKLMAVLGPAVIALGGTIGGGEWLIGPALFVQYGLALLWITTVSSILQVFLNLEMCRYTVYTGEPKKEVTRTQRGRASGEARPPRTVGSSRGSGGESSRRDTRKGDGHES